MQQFLDKIYSQVTVLSGLTLQIWRILTLTWSLYV